jgi:hypothetical protein
MPPVQLILAGAAFSTADEIRQRWKETVSWARCNDFGELFEAYVPPPALSDVANDLAGIGADGRDYLYSPLVHPRAERPSDAAVATALSTV